MSIDRIAAALLGAAFASRVIDSRKSTLSRIGYGLVGYDLLRTAYSGGEGLALFGPGPTGAQNTGLVDGKRASVPKFEERRAKTIAQRVAYVHEQCVKGTRDPAVYQLAREVLSRKCGDTWCVKEKDHTGEVVALFNEVKGRVRYTYDPVDYDAFQTPKKTLQLKTGDCDDYMSLLGALCRSVGIQIRSRIIQTRGETTWNHIYLMAHIPETNQWMPLDLSVNQPAGWEVPKEHIVKHRDFDVLEKDVPKLLGAMGYIR